MFKTIESAWPKGRFRVTKNTISLPALFDTLELAEKAAVQLANYREPSLCSCGDVREYSPDNPFTKKYSFANIWTHYCGCQGWD